MKGIDRPEVATSEIFDLCIETIQDADLVSRYKSIYPCIQDAEQVYEERVQNSELYKIEPCVEKNREAVVGEVTKKELKNLYTNHLVPKKKPARRIYDQLLNAASGGICPTCGLGHVYTLDHYLVKSKYPLYSILAINLVPACRDCNSGKLASIAISKGCQAFHPYFDQHLIENDQWLYARVVENHAAAIEFYVEAPSYWPPAIAQRANSHFSEFALKNRFGKEASRLLISTSMSIERFSTKTLRFSEIKYQYGAEKDIELNGWRTAFFYALMNSEWYLEDGFRLFIPS